MPMAVYNHRSSTTESVDSPSCTCGQCPRSNVSKRIQLRIMAGAKQSMDDLEGEAKNCDEESLDSELIEQQLYPCNFVPPDAREPTKEALLGAHDILLIIHISLQAGVIPSVRSIRRAYEIEKEQFPHVRDFLACGGSIPYILEELTSQVEGDMRGEAYHEDTEELLEALERVPPCALDKDLSHWRRALDI